MQLLKGAHIAWNDRSIFQTQDFEVGQLIKLHQRRFRNWRRVEKKRFQPSQFNQMSKIFISHCGRVETQSLQFGQAI